MTNFKDVERWGLLHFTVPNICRKGLDKKHKKKFKQDARLSVLDSNPSPPLLHEVSQFRKPVTTCHRMLVINTHVTSPKQ
jgi:hypothetical protein